MRREWTFLLATNGDDKFRQECWHLAQVLSEIVPGGEAEWESVKNDYGLLRITVESEGGP